MNLLNKYASGEVRGGNEKAILKDGYFHWPSFLTVTTTVYLKQVTDFFLAMLPQI